jgi:hypothetical protein
MAPRAAKRGSRFQRGGMSRIGEQTSTGREIAGSRPFGRRDRECQSIPGLVVAAFRDGARLSVTMIDYRRLSASYRIGLQLGGAAYFVLNYVPHDAHATVAESPAGGLQGDNSEPELQIKPAFDMRAVGALGATGATGATGAPTLAPRRFQEQPVVEERPRRLPFPLAALLQSEAAQRGAGIVGPAIADLREAVNAQLRVGVPNGPANWDVLGPLPGAVGDPNPYVPPPTDPTRCGPQGPRGPTSATVAASDVPPPSGYIGPIKPV